MGSRDSEPNVVEMSWSVLRGARGASNGSMGARSNVPGALAVLRHAPLYLKFPDEIEEAFEVLELGHVLAEGKLYPVAVTVAPLLFDFVRRRSPLAERIATLIARYASFAHTLEDDARKSLRDVLVDHKVEILGWLGRHDRAVAGLAIHVPELRADYLAAIACADALSPSTLLALVDVVPAGDVPPVDPSTAADLLDKADASPESRMCAAAFLARFGDGTPDLRARIDQALPPTAPGALARYVGRLWWPSIDRPVVAPRMTEAQVVFCGEKLVLVKTGEAVTVTLPWKSAGVKRGDTIKVGLTAHGQPKLAMVTGADGSVSTVVF
jgi:hypothetical protein